MKICCCCIDVNVIIDEICKIIFNICKGVNWNRWYFKKWECLLNCLMVSKCMWDWLWVFDDGVIYDFIILEKE